MTLTNIRYFIEAARCENFTEAANNLYVSQPCLSKQIALLEKEIGVQLFFRCHRSVRLTPAGRFLYQQLKDIPTLAEKSFQRARIISKETVNDVSVGILEGQEFASVIMQRLHRFSKNHSGIDIRLERSTFSKLRYGLENGHYDMIITLSFDVENIKGVCQEPILTEKAVIAISCGNPKSQINDLTLNMLADEDFVSISPEESPNGYARSTRLCYAYGFKPRIVRQFSSLENLLLSIEAGIGVGILDRNTRLLNSNAVRILPIPDSDSSNVSAVWMETNENPIVEQLVEDLCLRNRNDIKLQPVSL